MPSTQDTADIEDRGYPWIARVDRIKALHPGILAMDRKLGLDGCEESTIRRAADVARESVRSVWPELITRRLSHFVLAQNRSRDQSPWHGIDHAPFLDCCF